MTLFQDSGQTEERRGEEAQKLLELIRSHKYAMSQKEWKFVSSLLYRLDKYKKILVSTKQLFWLRDLRDKYALGITSSESEQDGDGQC